MTSGSRVVEALLGTIFTGVGVTELTLGLQGYSSSTTQCDSYGRFCRTELTSAKGHIAGGAIFLTAGAAIVLHVACKTRAPLWKGMQSAAHGIVTAPGVCLRFMNGEQQSPQAPPALPSEAAAESPGYDDAASSPDPRMSEA